MEGSSCQTPGNRVSNSLAPPAPPPAGRGCSRRDKDPLAAD